MIEAYGMTEAFHKVASNPLPPHPRKLGTVGFGTTVEIAIAYENGKQLGLNAEGEVIVRRPTVMKGYHHNLEATATTFFHEWFRTGDVGILNQDGIPQAHGTHQGHDQSGR